MPQFQMIDAPQQKQSFGSQLGAQFGSGLSQGIGQSLNQYFQAKQNRRALEGLKPFYQEAGLPDEGFKEFTNSGLPPEQAIQALKIGAANRAKRDQGGLSNEAYSGILDQLQDMADNDQVGTVNYAGGLFSPDLRESAAKFDSLATATLGLAQKVALKAGIRNQREFDQFMKRTVPNSHDNVSTIKGKIESLRSYLSGDSVHPEARASKTNEKDFVQMKDPNGQIKLIPRSKALEAQKAGGKLVQ